MLFGSSPGENKGFYQFNTTTIVTLQWPFNNSLLVFIWLNMLLFFLEHSHCSTWSKAAGQLKETKPPPLSTQPPPWCWKSARMSICRAHRDEALLHSNNSTRHILIGWVKGGLCESPSEPCKRIYLHTHTNKHKNAGKGKNTNTQIYTKTSSMQKQPETTCTQKRTSTCASSYMCTNTGAAVIWGMLNIYLSCLPGWLHQSALSLGLCINLTFKDSSPLGSYSNSETNCTHLYCNSSTSFLCYFFICSSDS